MGGIALALLVFPFLSRPEILAERTLRMGGLDAFVKRAKGILSETENNCITTSGESDQARFSKDVYFFHEARRPLSACENRFHLHYAESWRGQHQLLGPPGGELKSIWSDGKSRTLYRWVAEERGIARL